MGNPKRVGSDVKRVSMAVESRFPPYENIYSFVLNRTYYQVSKKGLHALCRSRLEDRKVKYTEKIKLIMSSFSAMPRKRKARQYSPANDEISNSFSPLHGCLRSRVERETSSVGYEEVPGASGATARYIRGAGEGCRSDGL